MLRTVADLAEELTTGDVQASVTVLSGTRPSTIGSTGRLALDLDQAQYAHGHGPCLHAAGTGETVVVDDARTERRWTDYMRHAVELGSLSSLSTPLDSSEGVAASLNLYAGRPAAFTQANRRSAHRFARLAGVAVSNVHAYESARELAGNLQTALESRAVIDQAKGVLIERHKLTADQAFQFLAKASMATNRKLRDVAEQLVRTGELPRSPRGP